MDIAVDIVSAWRIPLICGGVYDWSTGLIYRGGRYFDPNLGIWLALTPLLVVQGWRKQLLSCFKYVHSDAK